VLLDVLDVRDPRTLFLPSIKAMDWPGSLAIIALTLLLLLGLDLGGVHTPLGSPKVLCLLTSVLVLAAAFLFWEARCAKVPLMPPRLVRRRSNGTSLLVCFAHGVVNASSWYYLPLYLQSVREASPVRSGVLILPIVLVQACRGVAAGFLMHRSVIYRELIWLGMALMTLGFGLFILLDAFSPFFEIMLFEVIAGLGLGLVFQPPLVAFQASVPQQDVATATALFGFVRGLSTLVSIAVGGVVFQNGMAARYARLRDVFPLQIARSFLARKRLLMCSSFGLWALRRKSWLRPCLRRA
jgi:hypothetical protein